MFEPTKEYIFSESLEGLLDLEIELGKLLNTICSYFGLHTPNFRNLMITMRGLLMLTHLSPLIVNPLS
jgi:hypothetical protein